MSYSTLFNYRPTKDIIDYLSSYNMATQAVAAKAAGSSAHFKTTGTGQCVVNGAFVASLAVQATIDMSDAAVALPLANPTSVLAGKVVADNGRFMLAVLSAADGSPYVVWAHDDPVAEDAGDPTFKMPYYDPSLLVIGIILYSNDANTAAFTVGTTSVEAADDTYYQITGANILPHVDNIDKN